MARLVIIYSFNNIVKYFQKIHHKTESEFCLNPGIPIRPSWSAGGMLLGVVICYCWIFYHCIEISEIPSNSIIIYTIQSCSLEISISALRILFIDDLQFICDEFEVCEAETVSLRLRLFVAASYDSNPSHIDLSVGANTNLCRKRKADITDMRQYIVRICGEGHVACNLLRLQWLSKNFDKSRRILT